MSTRASTPGGVEEQLWPIVCATAVLVGVLATAVWVNGDFEDERFVFNGYTQLAAVAFFGAAIVFLGSKIKGRARRTAELAILLSLALHAVGGIGAVYFFGLATPGPPGDRSFALAENDEEAAPPADYHWGQTDDEQAPQEEFEKPVETEVHDQAAPATQVQPRDMERPVPAAEMPRAAKADPSPIGIAAAAAPGKPLDVRRPDAAKVADLPPPEALAMARQLEKDMAIPDAPPPAPVVIPAAPKEPVKSIEPGAVQVEKADRYIWARVAGKSIDPNNASVPPPRKLARGDAPPSDAMPAANVVARVPSRNPPRIANERLEGESAVDISRQGTSLARSQRGAPLPSSLLPDAGVVAESPAAAGSSPGSRLAAVSGVAVERSNQSQAPLGPNIASAGSQEFARGSSLLPTRRGAIDGLGRAEPSIEGDANSDLDELRAGSPGSDLPYGLAQSAAPARRAAASQTENAGKGSATGQSATLPRTQAEMGLPLPAATRIADDFVYSGAGGVAARPGGMPSTLEVGQTIAVPRSAGDGVRFGARADKRSGGDEGDVPPTSVASAVGSAPGMGPAALRRREQGTAEGDDDGTGSIPRAPGAAIDPRAAIDPVGPVLDPSAVTQGPVQGSGPRGFSGQAMGPNASLGGAGRLFGPGQGIGSHSALPAEAADVAPSVSPLSPQHFGLSGRGVQAETTVDDILSGDNGTRGISRGRGEVVVNSLVHEPLDAFRRGRASGGPSLGDSGDGQLTEPAIENGLEYFARMQFPDGHWSLHEAPPGVPLDAASLGELRADTAATGLALLAYMAAGYTHQDEKYRETVRRGLQWLVKRQQANGNLSYRGSGPTHFYSQGIATMALCEAYGMTQDRDLREPAQKAIDFIVAAQDPVRGGWRYLARDGSDTSVTGWQLMALYSAHMAGLNVPDETMRKIGHWLDLAQTGRGLYAYNPWNLDTPEERKGRAANPTMTAQAMIMRMYLGQDKDQAVLRQGADYLLSRLPEAAGAETAYRDCYYWYYATQAMYRMGGDYWKAWDARVAPLLRAGQIDRGSLKGSWSGSDPVPDIWGSKAGRHYVTAMHVLTLEFRYWHLPLFRELRRQ